MNYLVSPYYPESGGTVIDWMDEDAWVNDDEFNEEDFDDDDINPTEFDNNDIPF